MDPGRRPRGAFPRSRAGLTGALSASQAREERREGQVMGSLPSQRRGDIRASPFLAAGEGLRLKGV